MYVTQHVTNYFYFWLPQEIRKFKCLFVSLVQLCLELSIFIFLRLSFLLGLSQLLLCRTLIISGQTVGA